MAAQDYVAVVQQLYISYFGRPADTFGLKNFTEQLDALKAPTDFVALNAAVQADKAGTGGLSKLVNSFNASDEAKALYGTDNSALGITKFLISVFQNVLGRDPEAGPGFDFWFNALASGNLRRADAAMAITEGALSNTTPQGLLDAQTVLNKRAVATDFTDSLDTPVKAAAYSTAAAVGVAAGLLKGVDSSTDVDAYHATVVAAVDAVVGGSIPTTTTNLTAGVDVVAGGNGNDIFNGVIDIGNTGNTFTALDSIDGKAGADTLNLNIIKGDGLTNELTALPNVTVTSVETVNIRSAVQITADVSGWTGLTTANVTQGTTVDLTAAETTAMNVSGVTGDVALSGGSSQTVAATGTGTDVTAHGAAGAVSVSHSALANGAIDIENGTNVTVVASGATTGTIDVGSATDAASGTVTVTNIGKAYAAADAAATRGAINVTGGTLVTVNQTATSSTAAGATDTTNVGNFITQSHITVVGNADTTDVTVNQSAAVAAKNAVAAVAGVKQIDTVTFIALAATESVTVGGLTFTAAKALTAAQVAAAFANLAAGATAGAAPAGNGIYSGTFGSYSTGAVVTTGTVITVDATASSAAAPAAAIVATDAAAANISSAVKTAGVASVTAVAGVVGVVGGQVTINGAITGTDKIATVSLDGFGATSTVVSDALTTLNLAHSNEDVVVTNTAATTLALGLNGVGISTNTGVVNLGATYTALNVNATGADSVVTLTAGGVQALTVAGDHAVDLTGATVGALKTVTVSGSAGLTIDASGANVTAVDTSATTGTSVISIDATKATYTGGAGVDTVTLTTAAPTKAVSLGAGDDTLNLVAGTTTSTAVLDGGEGTDTLSMAVNDAATASASATFGAQITGFEKLKLGAVAAGASKTVDLANLDNISYVISAGGLGGAGTSEQQTIAVTGPATGVYTFQGIAVAGAANTDVDTVIAGRIVADKAAIIAAWNVAHPTAQLADISAVGATLTLTYVNTAGDVANTAADSNNGASFAASVQTVQGALGAPTGDITLTHVAAGATLELTGASFLHTVTLNDATGTADSFNIVTKVGTTDLGFGEVKAAGVETINITATDTSTTAAVNTATLKVTDAAAKSIVITGNSNLTLTLDATNTAVTSIDGSALTGKLVAATVAGATAAATLTGGSAADQLTANHISDVLIGGAGNDTLIVNAGLVTLTGGAGADTFDVSTATSNSNSYATITDIAAGDFIKFNAAAVNFLASKVNLAATAVFQDYANEAIKLSTDGQVSWFQYQGDTYVVENAAAGSATQFTNGLDLIVKLTGAVDLSTASFSSSTHAVLIG